jgi:hypothetical protein
MNFQDYQSMVAYFLVVVGGGDGGEPGLVVDLGLLVVLVDHMNYRGYESMVEELVLVVVLGRVVVLLVDHMSFRDCELMVVVGLLVAIFVVGLEKVLNRMNLDLG